MVAAPNCGHVESGKLIVIYPVVDSEDRVVLKKIRKYCHMILPQLELEVASCRLRSSFEVLRIHRIHLVDYVFNRSEESFDGEASATTATALDFEFSVKEWNVWIQ